MEWIILLAVIWFIVSRIYKYIAGFKNGGGCCGCSGDGCKDDSCSGCK